MTFELTPLERDLLLQKGRVVVKRFHLPADKPGAEVGNELYAEGHRAAVTNVVTPPSFRSAPAQPGISKLESYFLNATTVSLVTVELVPDPSNRELFQTLNQYAQHVGVHQFIEDLQQTLGEQARMLFSGGAYDGARDAQEAQRLLEPYRLQTRQSVERLSPGAQDAKRRLNARLGEAYDPI